MQYANKKYIPFQPVKMTNREWPDKVITKAPVWCSVDLRDGNQALVTPMQLDEKLLMFKTSALKKSKLVSLLPLTRNMKFCAH